MFEADFLVRDAASQAEFVRLVTKAAEIVCQAVPKGPFAGKSPAELRHLISSELLPNTAQNWDAIADVLRTVIANSVFVGDPNTIAHLHCPPLLPALAAEVVISTLNQSMDSFDQAPIATIVEQQMIRWLCHEVGFPSSADGTFTTGGSQSNSMGLLLARDACVNQHWNWSVQKSGLPPKARLLRIFCSEVAHFTVEKSAAQLGLGTEAVIRIEVDEHFRMRPAALGESLRKAVAEGLRPMAVVATAGTTDFGSVDPLREIAEIAQEWGAWLHVDAAYGGALLVSSQHRDKISRIEFADSITIDFHKLFWQPIPCSAFLLRDRRHFEAIKLHADYLNPESLEEEGIPNLVTTSLLTSRRFDALKLWISFQALGREKLGAMVDRTVALADHTANFIRGTPQLELMCEPQLSTVVFRYIPSSVRGANCFNFQLRQILFQEGIAVVGHTRVLGVQCLKFTCMNPATSEGQIEELIRAIVERGKMLEASKTADSE
ncbi:MAG TPA: aspartate aminotransferase family protein [Candidatus Eisenbacteria bacterium]|nr:aspartate aminotransferase family protein [Candidatus Eisenbacteria bacterium]